jgi:hypothetical protein
MTPHYIKGRNNLILFKPRLADIPCVIINGITKGGSYEVGSDIKYDELTSQWNAVYINDQWRFIGEAAIRRHLVNA